MTKDLNIIILYGGDLKTYQKLRAADVVFTEGEGLSLNNRDAAFELPINDEEWSLLSEVSGWDDAIARMVVDRTHALSVEGQQQIIDMLLADYGAGDSPDVPEWVRSLRRVMLTAAQGQRGPAAQRFQLFCAAVRRQLKTLVYLTR